MKPSSTDPMIQELRRQIAENDRRIAAALNARIALVARLKAHKEARGLGFVDAAQEERLLADLAASNPGPASNAGLRKFFTALLEWTKGEVARLERQEKSI